MYVCMYYYFLLKPLHCVQWNIHRWFVLGHYGAIDYYQNDKCVLGSWLFFVKIQYGFITTGQKLSMYAMYSNSSVHMLLWCMWQKYSKRVHLQKSSKGISVNYWLIFMGGFVTKTTITDPTLCLIIYFGSRISGLYEYLNVSIFSEKLERFKQIQQLYNA